MSSVANRLPRTRLKNPTYLNSPMARASNPKASAYDIHASKTGGNASGTRPAVAATSPANSSKTTATASVAWRDGTNSGFPPTLGTAPDSLEPTRGITAM